VFLKIPATIGMELAKITYQWSYINLAEDGAIFSLYIAVLYAVSLNQIKKQKSSFIMHPSDE